MNRNLMRLALRWSACALTLALCGLSACSDEGGNAQGLNVGDGDNDDNLDAGFEDAVAEDGASDSGEPELVEDVASECEVNADCDDGLFCNGAEQCFQGTCLADPRPPCADDRIECTVDSCDEEEGRCLYVPDDALCEPGQVCDLKAGCFSPRQCTTSEDCDDGLFCNGEERCDEGQCVPGTPPVCDDGIACTIDTCVEELQDCQTVPDHTLCLPGELCNRLEGCLPRPPCTRDDDCDDASFCNGVETCDLDTGECVPGEAPVVDDGIECTVDVCSEEEARVLHTPSAARCSDGEFCNGAEVCSPVDGCQMGEPPSLSDGVACTVDRCNEEEDFIEHIPDAGQCDDGAFCNGEEICHPVDGCQVGEPPDLSDGVGCTTDSCDEVNDVIVHTPSDSSCDDGLFCNGEEFCDPVDDCQSGQAPGVDDDVGCTEDVCDEDSDTILHVPNDESCDDGLFCNGAEVCDPVNDCQAGQAPIVDDEVDCTDDRCDEDNDVIVFAPNDARCDDALFCNGAEVCDPVNDCQAGQAPNTDDGVGCTIDSCDEVNDRIVHTPDDGLCDDALFCNGAEVCDAVNDCQAGQAPTLDDGVGCTDDACDEANDRIVHAPNNARCDDALFCNGAEVCDVTNDCQAGQAPTLDDGVGCTDDSCDEANDRIVHAPNDTRCDDALFCNGVEVCDVTNDCQAGQAPTLDDGVACTDDSCDEANDRVVHAPNDARCDDALFCNGAEVCDAVNDCQAGQAPNTDDGVGCTIDSCDEVNDRVVHTPDNGLCDDALFCNGAEVCDAVNDCQAGQAPTLDDGVGCTDDSCDEANDRVVHAPNDARCDDALFCNGAEVCDAVNDCQAGQAPTLDDGVVCTDDSCDEANDRVVHVPNDARCDDALFCNGAEVCDAVNDCQAGQAPTLDDGVACTDDSCDEANDRIVHAPNDGLCSDNQVCNGAEVCDVELDCIVGTVADDGLVCGDAPRQICLKGDCATSVCGDLFVDEDNGEQCDGQDGCTEDCLLDGGDGINYEGFFGVEPNPAYSCFLGLVDFDIGLFDFRVLGDTLRVTGGPAPMFQTPAPTGNDFLVEGELLAQGLGCDERYSLSGTFINDFRWNGTFSVRFVEPGTLNAPCQLAFDCVDSTFDVVALRVQ